MSEYDTFDAEPVAIRGHSPADSPPWLSGLDREILGLVAEGEAGAMVAQRLGLSLTAVAERLVSIRAELGVDSTAEAVRVARRSGLL